MNHPLKVFLVAVFHFRDVNAVKEFDIDRIINLHSAVVSKGTLGLIDISIIVP